nr:protein lifeguard 1-like [Penaeus vannamei]XP_027224515.1 protein lifeguard 1-like [Penaeus vannamei]
MYSVSADRSPATFRGESIRLSFFGRVLTVLAPQLLVTFGLAAMFVRVSSFSAYAHRNPGTFGFSLSVMCAMMLALVFCCNLRKKSPDKYIMLLVVAICEAYMLGDMSSCKEDVDMAIVVTMTVMLLLSVFAFWIKYDFSVLVVFVVVRVAVPVLFFGSVAIWSNAIVNMKYISLWLVLFSFCVVIDIQRIIGRNHILSLSPDELSVALHLHLDTIHVFMYILAIIGGQRR